MPLTPDEKMLRKRLVGDAIRRLREHLGISQTALGRMIDEAASADRHATTDGGAVWGWEHGDNLPIEWKRRELVRIAIKNGRRDLAAIIEDPIRNWRMDLMAKNRSLFEAITLLEICAINQVDGTGPKLTDQAYEARYWLMERFTSEHPPVLFDDFQRELWAKLKERDLATAAVLAEVLPRMCTRTDITPKQPSSVGGFDSLVRMLAVRGWLSLPGKWELPQALEDLKARINDPALGWLIGKVLFDMEKDDEDGEDSGDGEET
jgi:hypothetical protein